MGLFHLSEEYELYLEAKQNRQHAIQFMNYLYTLVHDVEVVIQATAEWYISQNKELYFDDDVEIYNRYELENYFRTLWTKGDNI